MAAVIEKYRLQCGIKPLISVQSTTSKKRRRKNAQGVYEESDSDEVPVVPKPTLQITKKDGCYLITMNPLKEPDTFEDNESPYLDCTPMQFRIKKKKPDRLEPVTGGDELDEECCCCRCSMKSETSSDSELDIEFTPPAGVIHPERFKKKKTVVHTETQYFEGDVVDVLQLGKRKGEKGGKKGKRGGSGGRKGKGGGGRKGKGKGQNTGDTNDVQKSK